MFESIHYTRNTQISHYINPTTTICLLIHTWAHIIRRHQICYYSAADLFARLSTFLLVKEAIWLWLCSMPRLQKVTCHNARDDGNGKRYNIFSSWGLLFCTQRYAISSCGCLTRTACLFSSWWKVTHTYRHKSVHTSITIQQSWYSEFFSLMK